jgi:hypothetical protein
MSSRRLFGAFSPQPSSPSPYIYSPPKRRWLPLLAAFGCGAVGVLVVSALPASRANVTPTLRIYTSPQVSLPDGTFLAVAPPQPGQPPARRPEERSLAAQGDQPTIPPSLKIMAEPIDTVQVAAKGRATTTRHVAHKSRRHERNDAYARASGSWRNSYGYAANRNSNWFY